MTEARRPTPLDAIAEERVDATVALHPEQAVLLGRESGGRYSDHSPDGAAAAADSARRFLLRVRAADAVEDVDLVTKLDLTRELELETEWYDSKLHLRDLANIASPLQDIRDVFDLEPTDTEHDWARIATRLGNVPAAVEGYMATLRAGIGERVTPALRQVRLAVEEASEHAAPDGFFAQLAGRGAARADASDGLRRDLAEGARRAAEAYGDLGRFLAGELAPAALDRDPVGRDHYALASRAALGTTIDLDETYEWGLEELERMVGEQEAIAREIVPGGGVEAAIATLDADPARRLSGPEALRAWMQETSDAAIEALGAHFDIPEPVRRLECLIAPTHSGVIYYTPPSDDFARPGRMWWSVPTGVTDFTTWREATTVFHEGVPGHHLQLATAVYHRDRLNTWRRNAGTSGYWEGWALYAERLMARLGHLDDPGDRLGMLDGQRMRAARVVLDLGVHLGKQRPDGGGAWDHDSALDFFRRHVHMDDAFLRFEVNRYLGWPGQAASYKVGQRVWERIRDAVRVREGDAWDERAFHGRVLPMGGMGLDTLERSVLG